MREVKERPLSGGAPGRAELDAPVEAASVHAFRWGMGVGGALMMLGGVISLVGIVNPRARGRAAAPRVARPRRAQVPCPERREAESEAALAPLAFGLACPAGSRRSPPPPTSASPRSRSSRSR